MNENKAKEIIKKMAIDNGDNEESMREYMKEAILVGYHNQDTKQIWEEIFGRDYLPSPEEFITAIVNQLEGK